MGHARISIHRAARRDAHLADLQAAACSSGNDLERCGNVVSRRRREPNTAY